MAFRLPQWLQRQFTEGLKKEIKQQGLIETGALYESIDCRVEIDEFGVMTITVFSVDYLKYLWFAYNLEKFVYKGSFLWAAYAQWTAYKVRQNPTLNWRVNERNMSIVFELEDF